MLALDTDEESITIIDDEFSNFLHDKEECELSETSTVVRNCIDQDLIVSVTAEDMFESDDETIYKAILLLIIISATTQPPLHSP